MTVRVYSGIVLLEEVFFETEDEAVEFASTYQDDGFKVRIK